SDSIFKFTVHIVALLSRIVPKISNRIGMEWTIALSLILLIIVITMRSLAVISFIFIGTLFIGLAIAIGNVLIPGFIKMNLPLKIRFMTGIYAVFMNVFGALGSGLSVPISSVGSVGWQGALGVWVLLAIIAFLIWMPQLRKQRETPKADVSSSQKNNSLWRSPLAWMITLFMGGQSLAFYTLITWLP